MAAHTKRTAKTSSTHDRKPNALTPLERRALVERPWPPLSHRVPGRSWGGSYIHHEDVRVRPHSIDLDLVEFACEPRRHTRKIT